MVAAYCVVKLFVFGSIAMDFCRMPGEVLDNHRLPCRTRAKAHILAEDLP